MQYVFQKNYTLRPDSLYVAKPKTILLVEPDPEACAIYSRHLTGVDIVVVTCGTIMEMLDRIAATAADVVIVNPTVNVKQCIKLLRQVRASHPGLPIISIGGAIADQSLDQLMAAGVTLHINRYLTQPRDLHLAVQQILT